MFFDIVIMGRGMSMLYELYTLKRKYQGKTLYIWNINRTSMVLFTMLAFRRLNIQGFVTTEEQYEGEVYMNRPVIYYKQIMNDENSLILVSDEVAKNVMAMVPSDRIIYWSDALDINEEIRNKKVILYGMGYGAEQLCNILHKIDIEPELYCVTKKSGVTEHNGKKVIAVTEIEKYKDYVVIIAVKEEKYRREILDTLSDFKGSVYMEYIIGVYDRLHINFMQNIDLAIKKNRKIYLYSKKNLMSRLIEEVLSLYGIRISGYIYDIENEKDNIKSIYELAYDGIEDKLVIINEEVPEKLIRARENVELAGFSLENDNYTGVQWYSRSIDKMLLKLPDYFDPLIGGSILYPCGKPGWKLYGKEDDDSIRIVVLGGSTSSEEYHPENWVSKLYNKLSQIGIKTTIYNGAHVCNDIVDEILRLLRDGYSLNPHVVISMSGVNNTSYKKSVSQWNAVRMADNLRFYAQSCSGIYNDESLYSFWSRNMKLFKIIAEFYGAKFFGFLQPMNVSMSHMTLREKSLYELEEHIVGAQSFVQAEDDEHGYINLMKIFEHQEEMFFDMAHYTDKAHEIIANIIYENILPSISNCSMRKSNKADI